MKSELCLEKLQWTAVRLCACAPCREAGLHRQPQPLGAFELCTQSFPVFCFPQGFSVSVCVLSEEQVCVLWHGGPWCHLYFHKWLMCEQKLSNSVLKICQHSRGCRQIILPFQISSRPGGRRFNLFQHMCFLSYRNRWLCRDHRWRGHLHHALQWVALVLLLFRFDRVLNISCLNVLDVYCHFTNSIYCFPV